MLSAVQQRGEGRNFIAFWDLETPKEDVDQGTRWTGQEYRAGWRMQTRVPNMLNKSENPLWDRGQSSFNILNREMPTNYGILKNRRQPDFQSYIRKVRLPLTMLLLTGLKTHHLPCQGWSSKLSLGTSHSKDEKWGRKIRNVKNAKHNSKEQCPKDTDENENHVCENDFLQEKYEKYF